jgi:hypothetical protein
MFKAENKNGLLKIPHLDRVSENFVSHSVFGDKFGKITFPWENFVGTFGVCECKSETCLDWPPDASGERYVSISGSCFLVAIYFSTSITYLLSVCNMVGMVPASKFSAVSSCAPQSIDFFIGGIVNGVL